MITDALLQLSSAQAVTTTAVSDNTIDLGPQARDIGAGQQLYIAITVDETVTASGSATVEFQVVTANAAGLGSFTVLTSTGAIGKSELAAGRKPILIPISSMHLQQFLNGRRYLGVNYVVATGPLTAGKFTANVVADRQDMQRYYSSGYTVA